MRQRIAAFFTLRCHFDLRQHEARVTFTALSPSETDRLISEGPLPSTNTRSSHGPGAEARVPCAVVGENAVAAWVSRAAEAAVRHARVASPGHGGTLDVFLESAEGKSATPCISGEEKTHPDQPEADARIDESEDAGEFRLISLEALVRMKLAAFRDNDRFHLRDRLRRLSR